jgi:hypothetical protein
MERDPGFRGMLSFLEVSPQEKAEQLARRAQAAASSPMGQSPGGESGVTAGSTDTASMPSMPDFRGEPQWPMAQPPMDDPPMDQSPMGQSPPGKTTPYMDVEGRGKRPLRLCHTVEDGHTSSEQLAYQSFWAHARKHGRPEPQGSHIVDIGLSRLCSLLATDHKNVKRLVGSLQGKLALEVVREPDYRKALPTRYRVYDPARILERRQAAGMLWVVRTRAIRFVDMATVNQLLCEEPMG